MIDGDSHLVGMLIRHEGMRLRAYQCTAGKITVGVGRNLEDVGLTEEEALILLRNDIHRARREVSQAFDWFYRLNDVRQEVILSMVINLGITKFRGFTKLHGALSARNWEKAACEMQSSLWAAQVKGRAVELAQMMRSGNYSA